MSEALAQRDNIPGYFYGLLHYGRGTHPCTYFLVQGALRVAQFQAVYYKNKFQRPRPSQLSPNLMPPIEVPGHASYPSGHATEAYSIALILKAVLDKAAATTAVVPSQPDPLIRLAQRIARNREILGLHYPSDSEAGKKIAQESMGMFLNCPTVARLVEAAAAEWVIYTY
jgi:membrane-associated phospholipid phosphatase